MKKQLVASLAAAMVLGVAGTSFAASNPFVDVPAKHWAYDSVTKLAQAGIVDGYSDGKFQGDKVMSRYEMAQIVAKAMAKSDKADASQKAAIDKLSVEFASELEGLNVRVTKLEKNASSVKMTGIARLRYEDNVIKKSGVADTSENTLKLRTRLLLSGNINEDWTYAGRFENVQDLRSAGSDSETKFNIATVRGHIAGIDTTIGRQEIFSNYGMLLDTSMDGVKMAFGNVVKTNVYYGRNTSDKEGAFVKTQKPDLLGADFKYATSKATNVTAAVFQIKENSVSDNNKTNIYEIGVDSKLTSDLTLKTSYAKASGRNFSQQEINDHNKAYFIGLDYKVADVKKVGSYSIFANYRNLEENAVVVPTFDKSFVSNRLGGKGFEVGFKYVPMANSLFRAKFVDIKSTANNNDTKNKFFQAQMEFMF